MADGDPIAPHRPAVWRTSSPRVSRGRGASNLLFQIPDPARSLGAADPAQVAAQHPPRLLQPRYGGDPHPPVAERAPHPRVFHPVDHPSRVSAPRPRTESQPALSFARAEVQLLPRVEGVDPPQPLRAPRTPRAEAWCCAPGTFATGAV